MAIASVVIVGCFLAQPVGEGGKTFDPKVGEAADLKTLSRDPKLQVAISGDMKQPLVREIADFVGKETGLTFRFAEGFSTERMAFGSTSWRGVPAYTIIEKLKNAIALDGKWVKEEAGYRLEGTPKPVPPHMASRPPVRVVPPPLAKPAPAAAPAAVAAIEPSFFAQHRLWVVLGGASLLLLSAFVVILVLLSKRSRSPE
jgi:hypothetical protein